MIADAFGIAISTASVVITAVDSAIFFIAKVCSMSKSSRRDEKHIA